MMRDARAMSKQYWMTTECKTHISTSSIATLLYSERPAFLDIHKKTHSNSWFSSISERAVKTSMWLGLYTPFYFSFMTKPIIMPFIYPLMYSPFIYPYMSDLISDHNQCESHQAAFLLFYASLFILYQTLWLILSHLLSSYITDT